jgi:hypothetical protein
MTPDGLTMAPVGLTVIIIKITVTIIGKTLRGFKIFIMLVRNRLADHEMARGVLILGV